VAWQCYQRSLGATGKPRRSVACAEQQKRSWQMKKHMRTILRHNVTNLYFESPNHWTDDPAIAFDFRFLDHALKYIENHALEDVEVAFAFESSVQIRVVPVARPAILWAA
jgi:hypothetical protein